MCVVSRHYNVKLRLHKGRLAKTIGVSLGRDGKHRKKTWYFPADDEAAAVRRILELKAAWRKLRAAGGTAWEETPASDAEAKLADTTAKQASVTKAMTVAGAATIYLDTLRQRLDAGQIARSHYTSQQYRLNKAIEPIAHLSLSVVGEQQVRRAVLRLAERPHVSGPGRRKTRRMSPVYARASISALKWFLDWASESDQIGWRKPSLFRSVFRTHPTLTDDERRLGLAGEAEVEHFSVAELTKLWAAASDFQRTLILLGINCAFANGECATLKRDEIIGNVIERYRRKTMKRAGRGSYGRWHLWPETIEHLERNMAGANAQGLALLTETGTPLVEELPTYHKDAISHQWHRLLKRAGVRPLPFGRLRKTSAYIVRVALGYGTEVAEMLLSHADAGMIRHYSGRDWDGRLREATDRVRLHVAQMFEIDSDPPQ